MGKYPDIPKKNRKMMLYELVLAEDLPLLTEMFNDISLKTKERLDAHCRINDENGESHWVYLSCDYRKDTFGKKQFLVGTMMDVSEYLDNAADDSVLNAFMEKNKSKISEFNNNGASLFEVLGEDYIRSIQKPFAFDDDIDSAIFDADDRLICSENENEKTFDKSKYEFYRTEKITFNRSVGGYWFIGAKTQEALDKNIPLLETLTQNISQIANAFVILYNEMENSRKVNQQLSVNIEQQMLINRLYEIMTDTENAEEALMKALSAAGEYIGLDRIGIIEDKGDMLEFMPKYCWNTPRATNSSLPDPISKDKFPRISDDLSFSDMSFSNESENDLADRGVKAYAMARLNDNRFGKRYMMCIVASREYSWNREDRKILRSVSQIVSTMLTRCELDADITDKNAQLTRLAYYDPMLDMMNRTKLDEDLAELISSEDAKIAVMALHIVDAHSLNEVFGQAYTDKILRAIGEYLKEMPVSGKTVYRYSGSVMMIILQGYEINEVREIANHIVSRFNRPWEIDGLNQFVEAGMGISLYPINGNTCEDLYRSANLSLNRAVEYGKNTFAFYSTEFQRSKGMSYQLEQSIRRSIADGMKGFSVVFQPVFNADKTRIHHCETLIRWENSDFGSVSPYVFIQLMEKVGLDVVIDMWVIPQACAFCRKLIKLTGDPDIGVSINLTTHEMKNAEIISFIKSETEKNRLYPKSLIIEVPEKAHVFEYNNTVTTLGALKKLGARIAIDSFGNEYLPLHILKNSYVDMIKIHQSLFTNANDGFDSKLLKTTLELAHSSGVEVGVKYIEHASQQKIVTQFDIDVFQGTHLAEPLEEEAMLEYVRKFEERQTAGYAGV